MKNKKYLLLLVILCILTGCQTKSKNEDILSQKKSDGRQQITILVKYAFTINAFEKAVEEKFPDIDIVQVGNYTANTVLAKEYEARLEHDDLTDIVMTWPLDIGQEYWSERLIDLSGMSFTSKYNTSMLDSIANQNGNLYYLPGPAEIRGIVYNKTMFEKNGWSVPNNYEEFINLCKQIEASGIRPFQLPLGNSEVLDTAFIGFNYGDAYSNAQDTQWLKDYNNGIGRFNDHFATSLQTYQNLIDEGIIKESDLNITYAESQYNLLSGQTAMTEDSVLLTQRGMEMTGKDDDEFALMPLFTKEPANDWARIYMTCFIGLNKHLEDKGNEDKYKKVIEIMNYISTPEGQVALSGDTGAMFSSLKNVKAPTAPALENLATTLNEGRYGVFPTLKRSQKALRDGLTGMLKGAMRSEDVAALVDKANQYRPSESAPTAYGQASRDFTMIETGNYVCDILKETTNSDIALFLDNGKDGKNNNKGISAKIYQGDITEVDIQRLFPDINSQQEGELVKVTMTGENLINTLEHSIVANNKSGWFYYFSGLKMTFDPCAEPGTRIKSIKTSDGKEIDKDSIYSVAIMKDTVLEDYVVDKESTGILIQDLLKEKIMEAGTITPSDDQRFIIAK